MGEDKVFGIIVALKSMKVGKEKRICGYRVNRVNRYRFNLVDEKDPAGGSA